MAVLVIYYLAASETKAEGVGNGLETLQPILISQDDLIAAVTSLDINSSLNAPDEMGSVAHYEKAMERTMECVEEGANQIAEMLSLDGHLEMTGPRFSSDSYRLSYSYQVSGNASAQAVAHMAYQLLHNVEKLCHDHHLRAVETLYQYKLRSDPEYVLTISEALLSCLGEPVYGEGAKETSTRARVHILASLMDGPSEEAAACMSANPSTVEVLPSPMEIAAFSHSVSSEQP